MSITRLIISISSKVWNYLMSTPVSGEVSSVPQKTPKRPAKTRWNKYATRLIKLEMLKNDVDYQRLTRLLVELEPGEKELSTTALTTRITRCAFPFEFALQVLRALKVDSLQLTQLPARGKSNK